MTSYNLGDYVKYAPNGDATSPGCECTIAQVQAFDADGKVIISLPGGQLIPVDDNNYLNTDLSIELN